jgi:hypothetical protein
MSTTTSIASLTVSELPFHSASLVWDYSLVEALSDAGAYMLQDSLPHALGRPQPKRNTAYLWENGCRLHGGERNCTTACTDDSLGPKMVWNASHDKGFTYQNCLVYPIIATSAAQNWLDKDSSDLLEKYGIIPAPIVPLETPETRPARGEYEQAWPVINRCRRELCTSLFPKRKKMPKSTLICED